MWLFVCVCMFICVYFFEFASGRVYRSIFVCLFVLVFVSVTLLCVMCVLFVCTYVRLC